MIRRFIALLAIVLFLAPMTAPMAWAAVIVRGTKTIGGTGGTAFVDGATSFISAAEMNLDFDTIYTLVNGQIDNDNIKAGAGITYSKLNLSLGIVNGDISATAAIHGSKLRQNAASGTDAATEGIDADIIDDYSADAAEQATTSSPGTSDVPTLATNLQEEIAQLRNKIEQMTVGTSASATASSGATAALASWVDGGSLGPNQIYNGGFDVWTAAADAAEAPWVLEGTPTLAPANITPSETQGDGQGMQSTGNGAGDEGINQVLTQLKASTRYLVMASVRPTTGDTCTLVTSGADTNDLDIDTVADNAFEVVSGVFTTDATPAAVTIKLVSTLDTDVCLWDNVGVYEISADPVADPGVVVAYDSSTDAGEIAATYGALTGLTASVTVPGPGYYIEVHAVVPTVDTAANVRNVQCRLDESGTDLPAQSFQQDTSSVTWAYSFNLVHFNTTTTPGTTYTYTVECQDGGVGSPNFHGGTHISRIYVKMGRTG